MPTPEHFWDKAAQRYAKSPIKDMTSYDQTIERTRSYLSQGDTVLEMGCGTGTTALRLADAVDQITATDISTKMIEIAQGKAADQQIDNATFAKSDVADATFTHGSFDAVMGFNLIHLLPDAKATIGRAHELLKPGGYFISKTTCLAEKGWALRVLVRAMRLVGIAPYVRFFKIAELEKLIEDQGFQIIETGNYPASPPSRFIVARKI